MSYDEQALKGGELLPLMEAFYTLQGEGFHTGKPAFFIRIGGCDVGCHWCDVKESWNPALFPPVAVSEIIEQALPCPARTLVVTGGEPLLYPLDHLCNGLISHGFSLHLETSGAYPISGKWDWICLSPKKNQPPLSEIFPLANELKVIIETEKDLLWAEENAARVSQECKLFLQPEWSRSKQILPVLIDYAMQHPKWAVSLQSHKFMNIP